MLDAGCGRREPARGRRRWSMAMPCEPDSRMTAMLATGRTRAGGGAPHLRWIVARSAGPAAPVRSPGERALVRLAGGHAPVRRAAAGRAGERPEMGPPSRTPPGRPRRRPAAVLVRAVRRSSP